MKPIRWSKVDGNYLYGGLYKTKAEVFAVTKFETDGVSIYPALRQYAVRVKGKRMGVLFDERDDALKYVETVVALQGE